jgi:DNA phosphorothioation-dependent restriction protein DptH
VTIDGRGRLVIVDDIPNSDARDCDGDGFEETIAIGMEDTGRIVAGDAQAFYASVRAKVADWGLGGPPVVETATSMAEGAAGPQPGRPGCLLETEPDLIESDAPLDSDPEPETNAAPREAPTSGGGIKLAVGSTVDGFERSGWSKRQCSPACRCLLSPAGTVSRRACSLPGSAACRRALVVADPRITSLSV